MNGVESNETAKRKYWADQLDEAHDFMMRVMDYPVAECGEPLASLTDAVRDAGVEAMFSQRPHAHGLPRMYFLRRSLVARFLDAALRLNRRGWVLRVEDGYRDRNMQRSLGMQPSVFDAVLKKVIWEIGGGMPDAAFLLKRLLTLVAQIPATGTHMTGSAIDISVVDRQSGDEVDRGAPYLEVSERTPMASPFVSAQASRNRQEITTIMRESGFVEYPYEFWHYSAGDAYEHHLRSTGQPAAYGPVDFDVASGQVTRLEEPRKLLNSLDELQRQIHASLVRMRGE